MRRLAGLLTVAFLAASCTSATRHSSDGVDQSRFSASRVKDYQSISQLRHDSSVVVLATARPVLSVVPSDEGGVGPIPATITAVDIDQVLWGAVKGSRLNVRQIGSTSVVGEDVTPPLKNGKRYLLFLTPFEFHPGVPTGQYSITGDIGDFEVSGDQLIRVLPNISSLPKALPLAELRQQLTG